MKKRIFIASLLMIAMLFSATSCKDKRKTFEYCEIGISLTEKFEPYDSDGAFDVAYYDGNVIVGMLRYSFVDCIEYGFLSTLDPLKFAEVYLEKSGKENIEIQVSGDVPYYTYTAVNTESRAYFYMLSFYRTPYAYFAITFITPPEPSLETREKLLEYAKSVYILEEHI